MTEPTTVPEWWTNPSQHPDAYRVEVALRRHDPPVFTQPWTGVAARQVVVEDFAPFRDVEWGSLRAGDQVFVTVASVERVYGQRHVYDDGWVTVAPYSGPPVLVATDPVLAAQRAGHDYDNPTG